MSYELFAIVSFSCALHLRHVFTCCRDVIGSVECELVEFLSRYIKEKTKQLDA